ncbi:M23 family metallopeptidase [Agromyces sp. SYSU T00194]|uniref:M23 family metallopeptidase n=1 Tax=Agromyces chitinivorans TaxID=3158560 RepID=UPI003391B303
MSIQTFWSKDRWRDWWGSWPQWRKDAGLGPHRGRDIGGHAVGTPIPALKRGEVVINAWSRILGWYVSVRSSDGTGYVGYCHMDRRSPHEVGDPVAFGETVGPLGDTGTSTGPHTHTTWGPNPTSVYEGTTWNPDPLIVAALNATAPAAGGGTPIDNTDIDPMEEEIMTVFTRAGGNKRTQFTNLGVIYPGDYGRDLQDKGYDASGALNHLHGDPVELSKNHYDYLRTVYGRIGNEQRKLQAAASAAANPPADVDAAEFATAVATLVTEDVIEAVSAAIGELDITIDKEAIAKAAADEVGRRLLGLSAE